MSMHFNSQSMFLLLTCDIPSQLTPWCTVLLEKLTGLQLVKKFPTSRQNYSSVYLVFTFLDSELEG